MAYVLVVGTGGLSRKPLWSLRELSFTIHFGKRDLGQKRTQDLIWSVFNPPQNPCNTEQGGGWGGAPPTYGPPLHHMVPPAPSYQSCHQNRLHLHVGAVAAAV